VYVNVIVDPSEDVCGLEEDGVSAVPPALDVSAQETVEVDVDIFVVVVYDVGRLTVTVPFTLTKAVDPAFAGVNVTAALGVGVATGVEVGGGVVVEGRMK
jgi:hypothetical protein